MLTEKLFISIKSNPNRENTDERWTIVMPIKNIPDPSRPNFLATIILRKKTIINETTFTITALIVPLIIPDKLPPILAFYIDWESIIINLITNSVWALQDTPNH